MKTLKIYGGEVILDDDDYERICKSRWNVGTKGYARRLIYPKEGKAICVFMHREVLMLSDPTLFVDHKNMNKLDNTKSNLRVCTKSQNGQNRNVQSNNKLGIKGVVFRPTNKKYRAIIKLNGKQFNLGHYNTAQEASFAYEKAAKEMFGDFARL